MSALKSYFYHYYIWLIIFIFTICNSLGFKHINYTNPQNVFLIVFLNLFLLFFLTYPYLVRLEDKIPKQSFFNFLDIPDGKIKFPHITSFLGEQALGALLATLMIVYGREILIATGSGTITALIVFMMLLLTVSITMLSLARISLQVINLNLSKSLELALILILLFITYWLFIGGLKLAP